MPEDRMSDARMSDAPMNERILLVEDDPGSQDLVVALCAARGIVVDVAADGFQGLRLLSEGGHRIVLIDYHLPEMDGYALARLMRAVTDAHAPARLIGITADRHGLASRRGVDALFDALLVKPLAPDALYATLERLSRPDPAPVPAAQPAADADATPADRLWRRRGLPGRPRAVLCPDLDAAAVSAVGQAFDLGAVEAADVILVGAEAGLEPLRALRAAAPGRHLPAFDLTGRLGPACDAAFRVDDAESWTALARVTRAFAARRESLAPAVRAAHDPAAHLLGWLHVGARALPLSACADPSSAGETGLAGATLMAALLTLTRDGLIACEAAEPDAGPVARLTEAGHAAAMGSSAGDPTTERSPAAGASRVGTFMEAPASRTVAGTGIVAAPPMPDPEESVPVFDGDLVRGLRDAIGDAEVERLTRALRARLGSAFPAGASRAAVAREAHGMIAMAGSLGFARLSAGCRTLERAALDGVDLAGADLVGTDLADRLRDVRLAIADVLAAA